MSCIQGQGLRTQVLCFSLSACKLQLNPQTRKLLYLLLPFCTSAAPTSLCQPPCVVEGNLSSGASPAKSEAVPTMHPSPSCCGTRLGHRGGDPSGGLAVLSCPCFANDLLLHLPSLLPLQVSGACRGEVTGPSFHLQPGERGKPLCACWGGSAPCQAVS